MDDYKTIIKRIASLLTTISEKRDKPIKGAANSYRMISEAICKSVIISNNDIPTGKLEKLISDATKIIKDIEMSRDAEIFNANIRYIQGIGNSYSHDASGSNFVENDSQKDAIAALYKIIRIVFFGNNDIEPPILPEFMRAKFPLRLLYRGTFENLRGDDVVALWHPKLKRQTKHKQADNGTRIYYDYIEIEVSQQITIGAIFLRERSSLEKSIGDFKRLCEKYPSELHIITPRVYRTDNREIDRKKSIRDISSDYLKDQIVTVSYFDEFVWNNCLPKNQIELAIKSQGKEDIIPQSIILEQGCDIFDKGTKVNTKSYIERLLNNPNEYTPLQIFAGPAGIGKTTFCDEISSHINSHEKKKVVFLSATDFRDVSKNDSVVSVTDLYRLSLREQILDEQLEAHNFEINLGCGNFVLIIDGFDELESHLGESLDFKMFVSSLIELESCFRNLLVIMTVRDYNIERFMEFEQITICRLQGFSKEDTNKYLRKRLLKDVDVVQAQSLLRNFDSAEGDGDSTTIPLYASLICDFLVDGNVDIISSENASFSTGEPIDRLVLIIINREIAKQSLGTIYPDQFFDILIDIIGAPQSSITIDILSDWIKDCGGDPSTIKPENFMRNPFLVWNGQSVIFKYDSLMYFFKSRFLKQKITGGIFNYGIQKDFMEECYRGEGALYDELIKILPPANNFNNADITSWFCSLIKKFDGEKKSEHPIKVVSAFFYWLTEACSDKKERSELISKFYGGVEWKHFSIFGKFYPLDLIDVKIIDGYLENFINLSSCVFYQQPVFYGSMINFDEKSLPEKLDRSIFGEGCEFSANLSDSFLAKEKADSCSAEVVRDNVYRILKVGFRGNTFSWKSEVMYRKAKIIGKHNLKVYLDVLCDNGVLKRETSHAGGEYGYVVSLSFRDDARKLIEDKNITTKMYYAVSNLVF
jgi:hypothetical protein